jgi:integrase
MARKLHQLTALSAKNAPPGRHADGGGLYLAKDADGRSRWSFFFTAHGRRREMGLGPYPTIPLADARAAAALARQQVAAGLDPIVERDRAAAEAAAASAAVANLEKPARPTFGQVADELLRSKTAEFRNEKHRAQWKMTLQKYAKPLHRMPVDEITTKDVLSVLSPIWTKIPETASRLRGRIERVLAAAKAKGLRSGENPAAWRDNLKELLPARQKLTRGHHAALPFEKVPEFMAALRQRPGLDARALEFCILTAARSGEVLGASWTEIDLGKAVWTVPALRMKAGKEHRVPLTDRVIAILREVEPLRRDDGYVFPGRKDGRPLSGMAMEMLLRRMEVEVTVHGFRSSFRDWAGEVTHFPREVAEAALAHVISNKAEAAYRRGDALEKRRVMMEAWAAYCEPLEPASTVVPFTARGGGGAA